MNLPNWALNNRLVVSFIIFSTLLGGVFSFQSMSKLEDPEIRVKQAMVVCIYPGASAHEVELRVADKLEKSIRTMSGIKEVVSRSLDNRCELTIRLMPTVRDHQLEQMWDLLRRKVAAAKLPDGARTPIVLDDFSDVFGLFYSFSSESFTPKELSDYAEFVKSKFLLVEGVKKVDIYGKRKSVININISKSKLEKMGIPPVVAITTLQEQTEMVYAGSFLSRDAQVKLSINNTYKNIEDIRNLLIQDLDGKQIHLSHVAEVTQTYEENPPAIMAYNQEPSLGISISIQSGENVINVGERIEAKIAELKTDLPAGLHFNKVFFQPEKVSIAISSFVINLIESILIVVLVLMLSMGLKSGLILGYGLILTIVGTMIGLAYFGGTIQRVSLASIIIAMGMLVDNAIVVIDGIVMDLKAGLDRNTALKRQASKTAMPLLGATFIAIFAFFPIVLSADVAGEYAKDLFIVIAISLLLSWVFALIQIPLTADKLLKIKPKSEDAKPSKVLVWAEGLIRLAMKYRYLSICLTLLVILGSIACAPLMRQTFFPDLSYNQLYIEYKMPHGTRSETVDRSIQQMEQFLLTNYPAVQNITRSVGGTPTRYSLVRGMPDREYSYGELIVDFETPEQINALVAKLQDQLTENFPEALVRVKKYNLMSKKYPIEVEYRGPDPAILRELTEKTKEIMRQYEHVAIVSDNWEPPVPVMEVQYDQNKARRSGVSRKELATSILAASKGVPVDYMYDGTTPVPIYINTLEDSGERLDDLSEIPILRRFAMRTPTRKVIAKASKGQPVPLSRLAATVPLSQVTTGIKTQWQEPVVRRVNGERAMNAEAVPKFGHTDAAFVAWLKPRVEAIELPKGYTRSWRGILEASSESKRYLAANVPLTIILIIFVLVLLFKDFKKPLILILSLPTVVIGIVFGMLVSGKDFGFMSIVGALGLMGMMIKNGVVLLDEIVYQLSQGVEAFEAVVKSAVSRIRPVVLASLTTILGMVPLLPDDMFGSMAATIISGLLVGTATVIVLIPVLYAILFNVKKQPHE